MILSYQNSLSRFHQFVLEKYEYLTNLGVMKEGKRTVRKEFVESFENFKTYFNNQAVTYLLHRYEIKNDKYHWPQILNDTNLGYIFHQDYSENISCSPKFEPQDAHFSSKQTSLHCTVVHFGDEKPNYAYHISDNKGHDSAFTCLVTRDLLEKFSDACEYPVIRIKSDNCATQYCCLHVFEKYLKLAKEIGKPILLYFGVNGHGRGLVDAMSGFGLKTPLRAAIVTDDFYFLNDEDLLNSFRRNLQMIR